MQTSSRHPTGTGLERGQPNAGSRATRSSFHFHFHFPTTNTNSFTSLLGYLCLAFYMQPSNN